MAESVQRRSPLQLEAWASGWPNLIVRDDLVLREVAFVSQINLRVEPNSQVATGVASALGVTLPATPNTTATSAARTALWLAPDEWLVVGPPDEAAAMEAMARAALDDMRASHTSTRRGSTPQKLGEVREMDTTAPGALSEAQATLVSTRGPGDMQAAEAAAGGGLGNAWGSVVDVSANRTLLELRGPAARAVLSLGCPLDLHARVFASGACAQTLLAKAQVLLWQRDAAPIYWIFVRASFASYLADWFARTVPDRL